MPPICFLKSQGLVFADSPGWWISDDGEETRLFSTMADQFPKTGPPSPIIGFARDGFPIFGPYDTFGNLVRSADFGGDLDECNGKMDNDGNYGYYLSVDPPFAPTCLRGKMGSFAYVSTDFACPKNGVSNTIILPPSVTTTDTTPSSGSESSSTAGSTSDNVEASKTGETVAPTTNGNENQSQEQDFPNSGSAGFGFSVITCVAAATALVVILF